MAHKKFVSDALPPYFGYLWVCWRNLHNLGKISSGDVLKQSKLQGRVLGKGKKLRADWAS